MSHDPFTLAISRHVWDTKYRYRRGAEVVDRTVEDTWRRVARALAAVEPRDAEAWEARFLEILRDFRFLPGGRILAGAGTANRVTLLNCFVMGVIEDSMEAIFDALKEGAVTMQQGGGIGYDFSTLRPKGTRARATGTIASGPVSFMRIWDAMCATVLSTGARRGAMMATLRCDHPDIEEFVTAKHDPRELRRFNLSVQVTDEFVQAVRADAEWPLVFPEAQLEDEGDGGERVMRVWTGSDRPVPCRVLRRVRARALWERIMRSTYDYAEPGVLFVDRINEWNNLHWRERITATNPCGELPLPPYGACDLGSVNLTRFVREPFTRAARLDMDGIRATVEVGVRLLDNVIDASRFPLAAQREQAHGARRIGLGVTGLADALVMLGLRYDSEAARALAGDLMREICHTAYRASARLAEEKGPFPHFEREPYLAGRFVSRLPEDIRDRIARHGIRNSHLLAVAPTGTISLLANNVSSGLEPIFGYEFTRRVLELDGSYTEYPVRDYAYALWRRERGKAPLPPAFVRAHEVHPHDHLAMQAALQAWVDSAISKTINVPEDYPFEDFRDLYLRAWALGLKGCTTYRPNPVTGAVLTPGAEGGGRAGVHCCGTEREAD